jgi:hypothetical protein
MNILNGLNTIGRAARSSQEALENKVRVLTILDPMKTEKLQERVERFYSFKRTNKPNEHLLGLETLLLAIRQGRSWGAKDTSRIRNLERLFWKKVKSGELLTWFDITQEQVKSLAPEMINYHLANAVVCRKLPNNFLKAFIKGSLVEIDFK